MARARKREAAKRDLISQWVWYAEIAGFDTADRFLKVADETVSMLAGQPVAGTDFSFTGPNCKECGVSRSPMDLKRSCSSTYL